MLSIFRIMMICVSSALLTSAATLSAGAVAEGPHQVDFTRDNRPILANNCFHCRGPDAGGRQAELRLDVWQNAGELRGAEAVIAAGEPDEGELIARITRDDPDVRMPP